MIGWTRGALGHSLADMYAQPAKEHLGAGGAAFRWVSN